MSETRIVLLGPEHLVQVRTFESVVSSKVMGVEMLISVRMIDQYLDPGGLQRAYGAIVNDELVQVSLTCRSPSFPSWYWIATYKLPTRTNTVQSAVWRTVRDTYLDEGLHMFSVAYPHKNQEAYRRLVNEDASYNVCSTLYVPANTRPPYIEVFNVLMGRQMWPIDLVVRTFLQNQLAP